MNSSTTPPNAGESDANCHDHVPASHVDWSGEWTFRVTMWLTIGAIVLAVVPMLIHLFQA